MRPSSNMSFEPGLERGVPWGRDLFTFVTSAAGHMMRTLQKPRKNKPSKRQVNHRRFLHNMIQRKFAEIEAANQQLASALFSADTSQSQPEAESSHKIKSVKNMEKAMADPCETETLSNQQDELSDSGTLKSLVVNFDKTLFKSKSLNHSNSGEDSHSWENMEAFEHNPENTPRQAEREQTQASAADLDNLAQVTNMLLEDSVFTWLENIEKLRQSSEADIPKPTDVEQDQQYLGITLFDMSPTSPAVSPLSLDSCDFEEQMNQDSDHCFEVRQITESLQMDIMEDLELLASSEEYLQSQTNMASSVWDIQSDEEQSSFQENLTFLTTSPAGYLLDNQTETECVGGVITGGLELGPQVTTFLEGSARDTDVELDLSSYPTSSLAPCASSCQKDQSSNEGLKDCYLRQLDITELKKTNSTWNISEKTPKGFEQGHFVYPILDNQALQSLEHAPSNQTPSIYRHQHHTHKDHTQSRMMDCYYVPTDADKNSPQIGPTLDPNSVYVNLLSSLPSSTSHCYGFSMPTQVNSTCREDFSLFSNGNTNGGVPSFEGVAQSFPAPVSKPYSHQISTPPLNDDWLFSNILTEQDFSSMISSQGCTYC